ncbi:7740_t:CDS:2 [Ambispora leptoticha]|uniref:7740_t:CDS:1 n=1 Tax=Ambispora leptoticha TaxID=144679 RepID=A0A9N8WK16_9GLOM|nr:7740_t:CDS:2 [Ambispora leptoticha]
MFRHLTFCQTSTAKSRLLHILRTSLKPNRPLVVSPFRSQSSLSYVEGTRDKPLLETTIGNYLDDIISKYGDRQAVVVKHENNLHWNYRQFGEQIDALARGLHSSGLRRGDRLGVFMPNNSAWITLQYATSRIGVILVTINPAYRVHELEQALTLVGVKSLALTPRFKSSHYIKMIQELAPELNFCEPNSLVSEKLPDLKQIIVVDTHRPTENLEGVKGLMRFHEMFQYDVWGNDPVKEIGKTLSNNDIINIQFTSGTTGAPKGASLSHRNILNNAEAVAENMNFTPNDVLCVPVPLYHCFGAVLANLAALTKGSSVVYPSEGFEVEATLRAIEEEKCTGLHGVPTMFIEELNHPNFRSFNLASLRTGIAAGSPMPIEVMKDVIEKMNLSEITIAYGMTETSPISFQTQKTDPLHKRVETVGRILPHVRAKVVDPQTHEILPLNTAGELCTSGYVVMEGGYWNNVEKTRETMSTDEKGIKWMHTGDTAIIDEEGYCTIVGRIKDQINRGGEKIAPLEVENLIFEHPGVSNISVVGVPDPVLGERICAWIIRKQDSAVTQEDIQQFCKGKIAHYKIPSDVIFVDEFPKTVTGKIKKNVIREKSKEILGL